MAGLWLPDGPELGLGLELVVGVGLGDSPFVWVRGNRMSKKAAVKKTPSRAATSLAQPGTLGIESSFIVKPPPTSAISRNSNAARSSTVCGSIPTSQDRTDELVPSMFAGSDDVESLPSHA